MVIDINKFFSSKFVHFISSIINTSNAMNVHLSSRGSKLLNDKEFASKVIDTVIKNHEKLDNGQKVTISNEGHTKHVSVTMVSAQFDVKSD
jgi:transcription elongation GreA/GreB family factor